jgi:hypothetical protein
MADDFMKDDDNDVTDPTKLIQRLNHFGDQLQKISDRLGKLSGKNQGPMQDPAPLARIVQISNGISAAASSWMQRQ